MFASAFVSLSVDMCRVIEKRRRARVSSENISRRLTIKYSDQKVMSWVLSMLSVERIKNTTLKMSTVYIFSSISWANKCEEADSLFSQRHPKENNGNPNAIRNRMSRRVLSLELTSECHQANCLKLCIYCVCRMSWDKMGRYVNLEVPDFRTYTSHTHTDLFLVGCLFC